MTASPLDGPPATPLGPSPASPSPTGGGGGSIYDLGYRGYEGPRLGRWAAVASLLTHSVRTAYGLGRSARSKVMPVGLVLLAVLPSLLALGIIALVAQVGPAGEAIEAVSPIRYSTLFPFIATLVFLFSASQAPELFGRDQRAGVLPLYFSRATSRLDYAAARTLGLLVSLLVLVLAPQLLLLVGRVLVAADPVAGLAEELPELPALLVVGLLVVTVVGTVSSAAAALTPRRSYATVTIIGIFLIPNIAAALLVELETDLLGQVAVLLSPADVLDGVNAHFFGVSPDNQTVAEAGLPGWSYPIAAGAWVVGSLAVLARRYQRIEA
jgi:ABC-2 type transport system permease protein